MKKKTNRWVGPAIALLITAGIIPTHAYGMEEEDKKNQITALPKELWPLIINQLPTDAFFRFLLASKSFKPFLKEKRTHLTIRFTPEKATLPYCLKYFYLQTFQVLKSIMIEAALLIPLFLYVF